MVVVGKRRRDQERAVRRQPAGQRASARATTASSRIRCSTSRLCTTSNVRPARVVPLATDRRRGTPRRRSYGAGARRRARRCRRRRRRRPGYSSPVEPGEMALPAAGVEHRPASRRAPSAERRQRPPQRLALARVDPLVEPFAGAEPARFREREVGVPAVPELAQPDVVCSPSVIRSLLPREEREPAEIRAARGPALRVRDVVRVELPDRRRACSRDRHVLVEQAAAHRHRPGRRQRGTRRRSSRHPASCRSWRGRSRSTRTSRRWSRRARDANHLVEHFGEPPLLFFVGHVGPLRQIGVEVLDDRQRRDRDRSSRRRMAGRASSRPPTCSAAALADESVRPFGETAASAVSAGFDEVERVTAAPSRLIHAGNVLRPVPTSSTRRPRPRSIARSSVPYSNTICPRSLDAS